jgi:NAD(P)-dependent dehydrogenase (short-subunit alcohol dehydrogenase family)
MTTELAGKTALITGAGRGMGRAVAFGLTAADWTLVGCSRSEQIYEQLYGHPARTVSICPEQFGPQPRSTGPFGGTGGGGVPRLTKCCLLERGITDRGNVVVVPWGARLDEVRTALAMLVTGGCRP